jgi:hypothetical protein
LLASAKSCDFQSPQTVLKTADLTSTGVHRGPLQFDRVPSDSRIACLSPFVQQGADAAGDKASQSSPSASGITSKDLDVEAWFRLGQALAARVSDVTHLTEAMAAKANLTELTSHRFTKPLRHIRNLSTRLYAEAVLAGVHVDNVERESASLEDAFLWSIRRGGSAAS